MDGKPTRIEVSVDEEAEIDSTVHDKVTELFIISRKFKPEHEFKRHCKNSETHPQEIHEDFTQQLEHNMRTGNLKGIGKGLSQIIKGRFPESSKTHELTGGSE